MITGKATADLLEGAETLIIKLRRQEAGGGIPAYQEGAEEPQLRVVSIKQRAGGPVNTALIRLALVDAEGTQIYRGEHWDQVVRVDDIAEILRINWTGTGKWSEESVFIGFVANPTLQIDGRAEWVEFVIEGFETRLNDAAVTGQLVRTPLHDREVLADGAAATTTYANGENANVNAICRPGIINPEGQPNRTGRKATVERANLPGGLTEEICLYEATGRTHVNATAQYWTLAQAVHTYLQWWNEEEYVLNPEFAEIEAVLGDRKAMHVDLSGARRLYSEILPKLLAGTPFSFTVDPRPIQIEGRKICRLTIFNKNSGIGAGAQLRLDPPGGSAATAAGTNVRSLRLTRLTSTAATVITAAGDFGYYQGAFYYDANDQTVRDRDAGTGSDFIQAWKGSHIEAEYFDEEGEFVNDETFHERHDYEEGKFRVSQYGACFRCFTLNEIGDYDCSIYNGGTERESYDFAWLFGTENYAVRKRKFCRTIERRPVSLGGYYQPRLFVSFDAGDSWEQIPAGSFAVSNRECRVTIMTPELVGKGQEGGLYKGFTKEAEEEKEREEHWIRAIYGRPDADPPVEPQLRLKLIAAVADDQRTFYQKPATGRGATRFEREALFIEPAAYPKRRIIAGAENRVSASSTVEEAGGRFDAVERAVGLQLMLQDGQIDGEPEVPGLNFGIYVGQQVERIEGRDISLAANPAEDFAPRYPVIVGVEWINERGNQATRIELDVARER